MPPDEYRSEGTPSPSEEPYARGEPFGVLFWRLKKVPRRKGETISRHYRSNGYVPHQNPGRLSGRLRRQASSHSWTGCIRGRLVGCQAAFAGKPAPTVGLGASGGDWSAVRPPSQASQLPQLDGGHPGGIGWLVGRHREQARSHRKAKAEAEAEADPHTTPALHHSTGRALARLQLLIYPPLREAEWRCLSGGGRVAPCGAAAHIERRSSRSRP